MKTKIVEETFDEITGTTTVTIQNKYGHFTGIAYCHPDDLENFSQFQGERIATTKANIEFCKHRIKQEKVKIKTLDNLLYDSHYLIMDPIFSHIKKQKDNYIKNIEYYENSISILKDSIKQMDDERQKVLLRSNKNK